MASFPPADAHLTLTADDVRRLTLRAQGFLGAQGRQGGVGGMLSRLGAVQLDTISVLARSHELVAYARLGPLSREKIERAYWHPRTPTAFEYWAHAACILPLEQWPTFEITRRAFRARGVRWHQVPEHACAEVLARLRADGPLTATQLGGAKRGGEWWDWSDVKIAVEWLLDIGDVVCVRRTGWRRVYDLPERVVPAGYLGVELSDEECLARMASIAARALGVVTQADLIDFHRLQSITGTGKARTDLLGKAAATAGLVPVKLAGNGPAATGWADPAALEEAPRGRHRTTLLSPFDSLVWDRKRAHRMFGFSHSLEAYVPAHKRVHGYFAMPLLAGGRLAGRVDPTRDGRTLVARRVSLERASAAEPMARALREAASWVGCDDVQLGVVNPAETAPRLHSARATTP
ncbi:MAG: winged helix-turn-helix domain-containing protein [Streptosporangiaceae bacterium]